MLVNASEMKHPFLPFSGEFIDPLGSKGTSKIKDRKHLDKHRPSTLRIILSYFPVFSLRIQ
jgi:hypothetical protein